MQWDFDYNGSTFNPDHSADGNLTPTHQYDPGDHVAAAQFADDCGHTNLAVSNVSVSSVPPDVSAGSDMTVAAGEPVMFTGTASALSGIASEEWDFNYGEETLHADASSTLTPTHVFTEPDVYDVAPQVVDNNGSTSIDTITVTVTDVAPTGSVVLSPTKPDGSPQDLQVGSPVYFTVSGLAYTDPNQPPSVWVDWTGDGQFDVVPASQWLDILHGKDGSLSFFVSHTYDDPGTYPAAFRLEDAEDNQTDATVPLTIADVAPSGTFGWGDPVHTVQPDDTVSFTDVTDPSEAATEAGFTYYYSVDGGEFQSSTSPDFNLADQKGFDPGTTHTIEAYIEDKNGGQSPVYTQTVHVQGDVVFANDGDGSVQLTWDDADGGGSIQLDAGATYSFADEPSNVQVTLLTAGASYQLVTNGSIDGIAADAGVSGVTLEVHTDQDGNLPDPVGDGHIGAITLPADSTLTVGSRGDFGGVVGDASSTAGELDFVNLTGPISGLRHIGTIQADGTVRDVTVTDGIDNLEGRTLGDITFQSDPTAPPGLTTNVIIGPGGQQGTLDFGNLQPLIVNINDAEQVVGITEADGTSDSLTYTPEGRPATITQDGKTYQFVYDGGAPQGVPPPLFGWIAEKVSAAVDSATTFVADVGHAVGNTIRNAFETITVAGQQFVTEVYHSFQAGVNQVTWLIDQTGQQLLVLGDQALHATVTATEAVAKAFAQQLEQFGKPFADLWNQLQSFGGAAQQVLQAIVNDPGTFFSNLGRAVGQGMQNFFSHLDTTLPQQLLQWMTAGLSGLPDLPDWSNPADVGRFLLQFFKLGWQNIQPILVKNLGAGNVALVTQVYQYLTTWLQRGDSAIFTWLRDIQANYTPMQIIQQVLDQGVQYVTQNLVPKAVAFLVAKFALPAAGVLSGIYDTADWIFHSLGQFQQLAQLATQIVNNIGQVIQGQTDQVAMLVEQTLNGLIPVGINFLATQLHLNDLPQAVANTLEAVRNFPLQAIDRGLSAAADQAKKLLGLNGHPEYVGLVGPVQTFYIGPTQHHLWTVATSTGATMLLASTPVRAPNPDNDPQRAQRIAQGEADGAAAEAETQRPNPNLARVQQLNTQVGTDDQNVANSYGATKDELWQEIPVDQVNGSGYEYAKAAAADRRLKARRGEPEFRRGAHNLGSLRYRTADGQEKFLPGVGTSIEFYVGRGGSTSNHAEQKLLGELMTRGNVRLVNLFSERTPCKTASREGDTPCEIYLAQNAGAFLDPGKRFNLYYLTQPGIGSDANVVTAYTNLNLSLQD